MIEIVTNVDNLFFRYYSVFKSYQNKKIESPSGTYPPPVRFNSA